MLPFDLKKISDWLNHEGFDSVVIKEELISKEDQIMVNGGTDDQGRNLLFYMKWIATPAIEGQESRPLMQFFMPFPLRVEKGSASDVARYLMLVNKTIEFPCLGICEFGQICFFRYVHFCSEKGVDPAAILTYLATSLLVWDMFGKHIEELSSKKKTVDQILQEAADSNFGKVDS